MNALVIDSARSCLTKAAKKDSEKASLVLDINMRQAQKILPGIQTVLNELSLKPEDLDYLALTSGPGTFTGLRLAYAALKAIELSADKPLYAVPTLDAYAWPYSDFNGSVISVIDATKDQFFAAVYKNGKNVFEAEDTNVEAVADFVKDENNILICGDDSEVFKEQLLEVTKNLNLITFKGQTLSTEAVFAIAEEKIQKNEPSMQDYDGPEYLRKSEAEIVLESKQK